MLVGTAATVNDRADQDLLRWAEGSLGGNATIGRGGRFPWPANPREHERMTPAPQSPPAKLAAWFMRRTAPTGVRRVAPLNAAVASDVGVVRQENQDRVALVRGSDRTGSTFILAALADGIGGMKKGAECAALTLGTFIDSVVTEAQYGSDPRDWLARACARANRAVWTRQAGEGGSTLAALLLVKGGRPLWVSIGDSRVYEACDGKLRQLSRDDTLEGQLGKPIEGGRRSELLQFVGIGEGLEPHIEAVQPEAGGTLLLTTDGVHFIEADFLARVIQNAPDLGLCARRLTEVAKFLGGPDNASVAALSVDALHADPEAQMDSTFEVWDPFGELQVMFDRSARRYPSTTPAPGVTPAAEVSIASTAPVASSAPSGQASPSHSDGATPSEQAQAEVAPPHATKGKQQKKTKGGRKPRQKERPAQTDDGASAEVPQLLIEFPNKTP